MHQSRKAKSVIRVKARKEKKTQIIALGLSEETEVLMESLHDVLKSIR